MNMLKKVKLMTYSFVLRREVVLLLKIISSLGLKILTRNRLKKYLVRIN